MTTPAETAQIVAVAYAQWPHISPDQTLATVWHALLAPVPMAKAVEALGKALREARQFPPTIAQIMDHVEGVTPETAGQSQDSAELAWEWIARNALGSMGADYRSRGEPIPAEKFPDALTHRAWRDTAARVREVDAGLARKIYIDSYRRIRSETAVEAPPSLSGPVSNVLEHPTRQNASTGLQSADLPIVGRRA